MNNPLAQQAQYYLNESSRLSEELNTEIEYSAVLEAVLEELVGTEDFLKIMEVYLSPGSIEHTASGAERSDKPGRNNKANVTKRIGQLGKILAARQSKPGPDADSTGIPARRALGNDGARKVPLLTRGDVDDQIARDKQGVQDAALAFKTHGGQVTKDGNLLPSPSNDNTAGIPMKDAKSHGVPVHIDPHGIWPGAVNHSSTDNVKLDNANAERLQRQGVRTQAALDREAFSDRNPMTIGQLAKSRNAEKAKKQRISAGQDAATRSGMVTMKDHYDLVQNIMNLLTSNEKNDNSVNELSDATHTSYRKKATIDLAERGLKARINGMQVGNAAATVGFGNPNAASEQDVEDISKEGDENSRKMMGRLNGLTRSERLKPLGGQPLDMKRPAQNGSRSATSRIDVSRRRK